jgi:hypothetical protein
MDTFTTYGGPANLLEAANTIGLPLYARQHLDEKGRWIDLMTEASILPVNKRPRSRSASTPRTDGPAHERLRRRHGPILCQPVHGGGRCLDFATTSEERPIRVIRRAPDRITDFGAGRFVSDTMMVDVRVSDLPDPAPGRSDRDRRRQLHHSGRAVRDRERLIWTLDLRPS